MRKLIITLIVVIALCLTTNSALAIGDPNDTATASVTVTVDNIVEWADAAFSTIAIDNITAQADDPNTSQSLVLYTNGNVDISANNSGTTAQLIHGSTSDLLITEYKLTTDGDGDPDTGADADAISASSSGTWTAHSTFLATALDVTHVNGDGAVSITLYARARNETDTLADAGDYTATQTLTAGWGAQ